jgi:protease I
MASLLGRKIAILSADGFNEAELSEPMQAVLLAGGEVDVIAPYGDSIRPEHASGNGGAVNVDKKLEDADPQDYDALILPGGRAGPAFLRNDENARAFAREFVNTDKPVGAICHGPWLLIDAEVVAGRKMTGAREIRAELKEAGADVVDREVVIDGPIVTSRGPEDLPAFCAALIEKIESMPAPSGPDGVVFI